MPTTKCDRSSVFLVHTSQRGNYWFCVDHCPPDADREAIPPNMRRHPPSCDAQVAVEAGNR